MIFFTSDLHFNHNREFIYKSRGFENIEDMNNKIVENWNNIVTNDDTVYVLGDLMLGGANGLDKGIGLVSQLNGEIHIVIGNHDTDNRINALKELPNVKSVLYADFLKYNGYKFFLTHYPSISGNLEKETLKQVTINLFGHTHQTTNFYMDYTFMYHVGVDSHDCKPVSIDDVINDLKNNFNKCIEEL